MVRATPCQPQTNIPNDPKASNASTPTTWMPGSASAATQAGTVMLPGRLGAGAPGPPTGRGTPAARPAPSQIDRPLQRLQRLRQSAHLPSARRAVLPARTDVEDVRAGHDEPET